VSFGSRPVASRHASVIPPATPASTRTAPPTTARSSPRAASRSRATRITSRCATTDPLSTVKPSSDASARSPTAASAGDDAVTSGLTLTQAPSGGAFTLTDSSGTVTAFSLDSNPTLVASNPADAQVYVPQTVTPLGTAGSAGIDYDGTTTDASYGDPMLMVAPDAASSEPSTTACPYPASASTWTAGCRGLKFSYNTAGDVSQVSFVYVGNSGTFNSVPVADYGYDASGRLTSEWDPRLSTPLVTGYSYDETSTDPDYGRITQVTPAQAAGSGALAPWTLTYDTTAGSAGYGNLASVSRTHSSAYGGATATNTIDYAVPLTAAAGGPVNMDPTTVGTWAQTDPPASAVAIFPPSRAPSSPPTASDYQYAQIDYDASGREVNTASYIDGAWAVTTTQYDAYSNVTWTLSAADQAAALASSDPAGTATSLASVNVYGCDDFGTIDPACDNGDQQYEVLTDSYGPAHTADVDGTDETIRTRAHYAYDAGAPNSDVSGAGTRTCCKPRRRSAPASGTASGARPPPTPAPPPTPTAPPPPAGHSASRSPPSPTHRAWTSCRQASTTRLPPCTAARTCRPTPTCRRTPAAAARATPRPSTTPPALTPSSPPAGTSRSGRT
jgi:hypothetical protein